MYFSSQSSGSNFGSVCRTMCVIVVATALLSGFAIASIVVAALSSHATEECMQRDYVLHLYLDQWLLGSGIFGLVSTFTVLMLMVTAAYMDKYSSTWPPVLIFWALIIKVLSAIFTLIWFAMGITILARSSSKCVDDATSAAVMTIIALVVQFLGMCCSGGVGESSSSGSR